MASGVVLGPTFFLINEPPRMLRQVVLDPVLSLAILTMRSGSRRWTISQESVTLTRDFTGLRDQIVAAEILADKALCRDLQARTGR